MKTPLLKINIADARRAIEALYRDHMWINGRKTTSDAMQHVVHLMGDSTEVCLYVDSGTGYIELAYITWIEHMEYVLCNSIHQFIVYARPVYGKIEPDYEWADDSVDEGN